MRHIRNGDLLGHITDTWLTEASDALTGLSAQAPEDRSEFIKGNGQIWSGVKAAMAQLSHQKCWYSEKRIAVTELEVDHFRPKNRVSGSALPHKGYWWLAFEWRNFRLAYSLINKRRTDSREQNVQGKGSLFPLIDEATRVPDTAAAPTDGERPTLIDPCLSADVQLLDYAVEDGKLVERFTSHQHQLKNCRAKKSIELFHLNEGTLIRDRHDLYVAIRHSVRRVEELEAEREANGILTPKQEDDYDQLINQIGQQINAAAPFSSFARACLKQIGDLGWNTHLLTTA
ncbi:hypothetical protein MKK70_27400 [Methylobacterium sp. E-041]|uniref:hypothetical protein n=1 Tax=Methylobacterium sp. E-041 TaxID=2836573 RepID=UPI001FB90A55|nr:hypothetical protein [Methylobacterium sp. E-041]MCJ2109027.1 hypothetical protein [Methylobacterium sp. E-041]